MGEGKSHDTQHCNGVKKNRRDGEGKGTKSIKEWVRYRESDGRARLWRASIAHLSQSK